MSRQHVYPLNDIVEHDTENFDECVCGPDVEFVDGGSVITHHALDGREHAEHDHDRGPCVRCAALGD